MYHLSVIAEDYIWVNYGFAEFLPEPEQVLAFHRNMLQYPVNLTLAIANFILRFARRKDQVRHRLDTSVPARLETLIRRIPMEVLCLQILVSQTRSVTSTGRTATEAMPLV